MPRHHTDDPGMRAKDIADHAEKEAWKETGDASESIRLSQVVYQQSLVELAGRPEEKKRPEDFRFPVFGTQGGGLARKFGNTLIFVTKPDCPGLDVGDTVPEEWDFQPANKAARYQIDDEQADLDQGFSDFFNMAFDMADHGKISLDQVGQFFPAEVVARNSKPK